MYKYLIFDLDGTILDTIGDITTALNVSLKECGYPFSYDDEGTKKLIGMGAHNIISRVFKNRNHTEEEFNSLLKVFSANYKIYQGQTTHPYPGIVPFLDEMKRSGVKIFVASNKPDHLAKEIVERIFGKGYFDDVFGHQEGKPEKPNPYLVDLLMKKHGATHSNTLFVGDSDVDVATGINARIDVALVLWGYGDYQKDLLDDATFVIKKISELKSVVFTTSKC
ncbi:MAG: HAD family hydrolase [Bacteroidia bacterium]|nr:HAD family hydrolase [Bacteroidia bacterium]